MEEVLVSLLVHMLDIVLQKLFFLNHVSQAMYPKYCQLNNGSKNCFYELLPSLLTSYLLAGRVCCLVHMWSTHTHTHI